MLDLKDRLIVILTNTAESGDQFHRLVSMASDALRHQVAARWQESFARLNRNEQGISGLVTFSEAWGTALNVLYPRRLDEPKKLI